MLVDEFDVVRLKDGREGTIVEIYDKPGLPLAYEVEFLEPEVTLETVTPDQIAEVIWKASKQ